ncbi:hypothetical protein GC163_11575 [bacterium]|nr:hypothetical protein [bacterium]
MRSRLVSCGCLLVSAAVAGAQEPVINQLTPSAILPGQGTAIAVSGGNLNGAKGVWTSFAGSAGLTEAPENGTKADQVSITITPGSDVPVGIHAVRILTDHGVSPIRFLLVDDLPTVAQAGNNTAAETAQALTLPTAVDGNVGNLSVQYFKFTATEGQRLSFEVLARRIGSPLDPMIRLLNLQGRELAFSDDAPGLSGDAQLSHTFTVAGDYLLELRDIKYQGGPYRLRIGDFPAATTAYPMAIQRGKPAQLTLTGSGVEGLAPLAITAPTDAAVAFWPVSLKAPNGQASGFSYVEVVDRPQALDAEPNNTAEQPQRVELTHDINGRLEQPGDVDRFVFKAAKDSSFVFTGVTRTQGSPTDLNMKVLKADGSQIAIVDDTGTDEGTVTVKFPEEADYTLVVNDLANRGGPDYAYRVAIAPSAPAFSLTASTDTLNIPAGGSVMVTVTTKRAGYGGPIELTVNGLPEGVTASRSVIGPGRNDAVITLTAGPNYAAGSLQTATLAGTGMMGASPVTSTAEFTGVLKQRFANMRFPPQTIASTLAISATGASGYSWKAEPAEVTLGKQLSSKFQITATRRMGNDEAITVALQPAQNGLPAGITVAVKNIDKGANTAEIVVTADDKAAVGDYTIAMVGTLKQDKTTHTQPIAVRVIIADPLKSQVELGEGKLAVGGELLAKVKVERNPALSGPVEVAFVNLPAGVTAEAATIPADQTETMVKLTASADAAKGAVNNVQVKLTAAAGNAKFEAVSPNATLTVE